MKSLRDMEEKVSAYFEQCAAEARSRTRRVLSTIWHIADMYDRYARAELKRYRPFALCLERARLRRESILVREIFASENRSPTAKLFLVKQAGTAVQPSRQKQPAAA
jgi:hypothetical protein